MQSFAELRQVMVDCQLRTYDVTDRSVLTAAGLVPREAFVPASAAHLAYLDQPVPLAGTSRALMAPMVAARMIQHLDVQPGEPVLEYAGGSGYGAAVMAKMGAQATLWEPDEAALALARQAFATAGLGVTPTAARPDSRFAAILVGGACETVPEMLFDLLAEDGRLIAIIGQGRAARVTLYRQAGSVVSGQPVFDAAAPALAEFRRKPEFVF
jgi:protein-L-isoaspartate(D-aspartate) O-methyltransferase